MKYILISILLKLTMPNLLYSQDVSKMNSGQFESVRWLIGSWKGDGWFQTGRDKRFEFYQEETVISKLSGTIITIEGLGISKQSSTENPIVIHNAFAVLSEDKRSGKFLMRAYTKEGKYIEADAKIENGKLIWGFDHPQAGKVRYTLWQDDEYQWQEIGEFSRDEGKTWHQNFGMTLKKAN